MTENLINEGQSPVSVAAIFGSPSLTSRSAWLVQHITERLAADGTVVANIRIADLPPEALIRGIGTDREIERAVATVVAATAVVVGTPVYKAAYSGLLKVFLDLLPQEALKGKAVLPVVTGGGPAHFLSLDYALRPVLAALAPEVIFPGVYAMDAQIQFSESGGLRLAPDLETRLNAQAGNVAGYLQLEQHIRDEKSQLFKTNFMRSLPW